MATGDGLRERLKTLQMGETVEAFAYRCSLPVPTLRKYLSGERMPSHEQLITISKSLGIGIDWLLSGKLAKSREMTDEQIIEICKYDQNVIEIDMTLGKAIPVLKTYDDEKHHLQFFCIHCNCWHFHGRGGTDYPYTIGRGGMAGDRSAHCFTMNSPFIKNGVILDVIGKLRDLKSKQKSETSKQCPHCHEYYSAAFNACVCGWEGEGRVTKNKKLHDLYVEISRHSSSGTSNVTTEKVELAGKLVSESNDDRNTVKPTFSGSGLGAALKHIIDKQNFPRSKIRRMLYLHPNILAKIEEGIIEPPIGHCRDMIEWWVAMGEIPGPSKGRISLPIQNDAATEPVATTESTVAVDDSTDHQDMMDIVEETTPDQNFSITEMLEDTRIVLESDTVYRQALASNIRAFKQAVINEEKMKTTDEKIDQLTEKVETLTALIMQNQATVVPEKKRAGNDN